jgi:hypothetical protein
VQTLGNGPGDLVQPANTAKLCAFFSSDSIMISWAELQQKHQCIGDKKLERMRTAHAQFPSQSRASEAKARRQDGEMDKTRQASRFGFKWSTATAASKHGRRHTRAPAGSSGQSSRPGPLCCCSCPQIAVAHSMTGRGLLTCGERFAWTCFALFLVLCDSLSVLTIFNMMP